MHSSVKHEPDDGVHAACASLGVKWRVYERQTRLQRLIGAFPNESVYSEGAFHSLLPSCRVDYVWALNTDRIICSSNGQSLEKPRQAQYLTHASFVPDETSLGNRLLRQNVAL